VGQFTQDHKKVLNASEQTELVKAFKNYDKNHDGTMDAKEFRNIMIDLGYRKTTDEDVQKMLTSHDKNSDGVISWSEFLIMMIGFKGDQSGKFGTITGDKAVVETAGGGKH
jgi:Ca2+-binding EF-hand superfamily protein